MAKTFQELTTAERARFVEDLAAACISPDKLDLPPTSRWYEWNTEAATVVERNSDGHTYLVELRDGAIDRLGEFRSQGTKGPWLLVWQLALSAIAFGLIVRKFWELLEFMPAASSAPHRNVATWWYLSLEVLEVSMLVLVVCSSARTS